MNAETKKPKPKKLLNLNQVTKVLSKEIWENLPHLNVKGKEVEDIWEWRIETPDFRRSLMHKFEIRTRKSLMFDEKNNLKSGMIVHLKNLAIEKHTILINN